MLNQALLFLFVFLANTAEATTGFGGVIIALSLGAQFFPIDFLVASFAPINLLLSTYLVARHHRHIDHAELWKRILPITVIGLPIGIIIADYAKSDLLALTYGFFVLSFGVIELLRIFSRRFTGPQKVTPAYSIKRGFPWLFAGGVIHGIYLSGGPLIVTYAIRAITDKSRFRSTLSSLWLLLNLAVFVGHIFSGRTTAATLKESAFIFPALLAGIVAGEYLHKRISPVKFLVFVFSILIFAGASLTIKALLQVAD